MGSKLCWLKIAPTCTAAVWIFVLPAIAAKMPKTELSWKKYHNKTWGYCVSYPSRWLKGEAFEGSGLVISTHLKKHFLPLAEIDVSARADEQRPGDPVLLAEAVRAHLEDLKKFERAQRIETLEQHVEEISNDTALFTKQRYVDAQDGKSWIEEMVLRNRGTRLYRFELECRADQIARFEPVFTYLLSTFAPDCKRRR